MHNLPPARFLTSLGLLAFGLSFSSAQFPGSMPVPKDLKKGFDAIQIKDAQKWLGFLAGPETQGRGTGQPGYQKAAEFMAARFKELGLKPIGVNGTYFQNVPFIRTTLIENESGITVNGHAPIAVKGNLAFTNLPFSVSNSGMVVFIKLGETQPEFKANDLAGRVVVLWSNTERIPFAARRAILDTGPAALLLVADSVQAPFESFRRKPENVPTPPPTMTLQATITKEAAATMARDLEGEVPAAPGIFPQKNAATVRANVNVEDVNVPNVVGMLPGSDKVLKDEYVGVGAHLDHLGTSNGTVYPGADDDGSGSTALLEVAKALKSNKLKPKRSIIFMEFCGEEMGLLGSAYYSNNPIFPLDQMICELQMDMVGRNSDGATEKAADNVDTMRLVGSKRISMELHNAVLDANKYLNFRFLYDQEAVYTRSDHYNFAAKGVPISFLFDGFHPDYHQPTDTVDKINWEKLTNAAKLYYLTIMDVANRPVRLKHDAAPGGN